MERICAFPLGDHADTMLEVVLTMAGSVGFDEALVEGLERKVKLSRPPFSRSRFIVISVNIEFCAGARWLMKPIRPFHEKSKCIWVRVGHAKFTLRLETLSPVESHACDPEQVMDQVFCISSRPGLHQLDLRMTLPLSVTAQPGDSRAGSRRTPLLDRLDLLPG